MLSHYQEGMGMIPSHDRHPERHGAEAVIRAFPKMSSASSPLPKLPRWPRACLGGRRKSFFLFLWREDMGVSLGVPQKRDGFV